jgi:ABC-type glycerol-3-phosphate transport system permease component
VEHGDRLGGRHLHLAVRLVLAAYAIERLRFQGAKQVGLSIFLAYLVPPSILFIPLAPSSSSWGCSTPAGR